MEKKVLITSRSFGKINDEGYRILEGAGFSYLNTGSDFDQAAFERMIPEYDALIIGAHPFPAEVLARCEKLRIICKHGAGLDNVPLDQAKKQGVKLVYLNTANLDARAAMLEINGGKPYDDILVFAPVPALVELADSLLGKDGCLNFFSGPSDPNFSAKFNFYNVHYAGTHIVGTSGGNTDDMKESLDMMSRDLLNPAILVTHIGGLNCVPETTLNLPHIPGGKKLIYTHIDLPLTAIADFGELGKTDPLFKKLHDICQANNGLWCLEAEKVLLEAKA